MTKNRIRSMEIHDPFRLFEITEEDIKQEFEDLLKMIIEEI